MSGILWAYRRRDDAEAAQCRGEGAALSGEGELGEAQRIEIGRVLRETRRRRMLDALVDGQDRQVAGAGEAAVVEHLLQVAKHRDRPVAVDHHAIDEIGPRKVSASRSIVLHSWPRRKSASSPRTSRMLVVPTVFLLLVVELAGLPHPGEGVPEAQPSRCPDEVLARPFGPFELILLPANSDRSSRANEGLRAHRAAHRSGPPLPPNCEDVGPAERSSAGI